MRMYGVYVWYENSDGTRENVVKTETSRRDVVAYYVRMYSGRQGYHGNVITGGNVVYHF